MSVTNSTPTTGDGFRHEALLYADDADYLDATIPFITDGLARDEPILIVVGTDKANLLRCALGRDADRVRFADMAAVGRNPARIIPAWRSFLDEHVPARRPVRGIGEPIWSGRTPAELAECQEHERLLNLAFGGGPPFWLLCPYNTATLDPAVLEEAHRSHPYVLDYEGHRPSSGYDATQAAHAGAPLPEPAVRPELLAFDAARLGRARRVVAGLAEEAGLGASRTAELVLAINELATNSLLHGGGTGTLRLWRDPDSVICEVSDQGVIDEPLAGREHPGHDPERGRGLWLVNQLCDLVQIRSGPAGTVVRVHMSSSL
jgi:anti-sigma regulatory factor (Ser/Thr protein kinase)